MDKLGVSKFMQLIVGVPIIIVMSMVGILGLFAIGETYIISNIAEITEDTAELSNVDQRYINEMGQVQQNYDDSQFPFELLFSLVLISAFIGSLFIAIKANPLPTFSFLGYASVGMMVMLLIIVFLDQFLSWFVNDFFYAIFESSPRIPLITWYFENLSLVSSIWFAVLLFLNQVELTLGQSQAGGGFQE